MAYYPRTPRMATPRLAPQPPQFLYSSSPYQSAGSHYPQHYHVAASEPSRGHHRSSSRSRNHKRSHSSSGNRHRHRHRSSTPSYPVTSHYSPSAQYATVPSTHHRRHSYSAPHHQRSSIRDPRRSAHYGHRDHPHMSHRGESIGERIKRFFGIGTHKVRFVDHSGHQVDRFGRPVYAL